VWFSLRMFCVVFSKFAWLKGCAASLISSTQTVAGLRHRLGKAKEDMMHNLLQGYTADELKLAEADNCNARPILGFRSTYHTKTHNSASTICIREASTIVSNNCKTEKKRKKNPPTTIKFHPPPFHTIHSSHPTQPDFPVPF